MKVYKFDIFTSYTVDPHVLTVIGGSIIKDSFQMNYRSKENEWIVPVPKAVEVLDIDNNSKTGHIDVKNLIEAVVPTFNFDSKLFFHSDCTIPRAKVTQKYTRVLNSSKADICVVPTPAESYRTEYVAIFLNKLKGKVYTIRCGTIWNRGNSEYITPEICKQHPLGTKITAINPFLKNSHIVERKYYGDDAETYTQDNWLDFLDATLAYCGQALILPTKDKWVGDYLYNTMHDVVSEDKILATLGDATNELNREAYDSIFEMLNSTDSTVVGLGLKTLAELDYKKYYNTAIYLLNSTSIKWRDNPMKKNVSVKYMLKFFGLWNYVNEYYSDSTTQEDFDMLKEVVEAEFKERVNILIQNFHQRFPFVEISHKYSFSVNPKLNTPTGHCDNLEKNDDYTNENED